MKREEIIEKIKEIIRATLKGELDTTEITETTLLVDEVGINSIAAIEILVRIENEFEIEIDDEDLSVELIRTIATLADYILVRI